MGGGYSLDVALAEPDLAARRHQLRASGDRSRSNEEDPVADPWPLWRPGPGHHTGRCEELQQAMEKLGKKIDVKIYPDAGHAFENPKPTNKRYRADDAADAWQRTVRLPGRQLEKVGCRVLAHAFRERCFDRCSNRALCSASLTRVCVENSQSHIFYACRLAVLTGVIVLSRRRFISAIHEMGHGISTCQKVPLWLLCSQLFSILHSSL